MIKRFLAALAFLTRLPLPAAWNFDAADVGHGTLFFPLVGALLGAAQWGAGVGLARVWPLDNIFAAALTALLLLALQARLTGALHLDGLADMADGFGGGRTREDVLRIMRDHVIGAYGAVVLLFHLLLKTVALAWLLAGGKAGPYLVLAAAAGRWGSVFLGKFWPYARREGGLGAAVTDYVGWFELAGATIITALLAVSLANWRGGVCWLAALLLTLHNGYLCRRRIGGVTGDTMGANTEIGELAVLLTACAL